MSLYSLKTPQSGVQPWSQAITLFPGGGIVSAFFDLYKSLGDAVLTGSNFIPTVLDGPEKVVRYGALTVGDGTLASSLTASQRCKGLVILCDSLLVKNNASVNMTGKGARVMVNDDPLFPFVDFKIPSQITISSSIVSQAKALETLAAQGFAPWDQGSWASVVAGLFGINLAISQAGTIVLLTAAGCGSGAGAAYANGYSTTGNAGAAGTNGAPGGGGSGGVMVRDENHTGWGYSTGGGASSPYGGGSGGGACYAYDSGVNMGSPWGFSTPRPFSGPGGTGGGAYPTSAGGGAGNPPGGSGSAMGGTGVGGKLVIICRGTVTVQAGGKIEANGMPGAFNGATNQGGGSGGGHVSIITPTFVNGSTVQAAGGGNGGAGSVVTKTFTQMGW